MINEEFVLKKVKPYLDDENRVFKDDFKEIFDGLSNNQLREILQILKDNEIKIALDMRISKEKKVNIDYQQISKLSNEQLCALYNQGNKDILIAIIQKNEKLIWSRVRKYDKYLNHKLDEDDLFQIGVMGLIKAVDKFENDRGNNLTTYSIWWIDQMIRREIIDTGFTVRIPVHVADRVLKVNTFIIKNPQLSKSAIKEYFMEDGMTPEAFELVMDLRAHILAPTSINALVGEEEESELIDFIIDKDNKGVFEEVADKMLKEVITSLLDTLTPKEERVLSLRYGLKDGKERTLEEVGKFYNVTRERIRQIESKALKKLRHPSRLRKLENYYIKD